MTLYLLRHAVALDRSRWHKADSERPLTREGAHKFRKVARGMKRLKLSFDQILTSPYRRAYDTAEIVADTFKAHKKLKVVEALGSNGSPQQLVHHLAREYKGKKSILLVGHEPYLSRLTSVLLGAEHPEPLELKKGGLARLAVDTLAYKPCATLKWWLTPKLLKALGNLLLALALSSPAMSAENSLQAWSHDFHTPEVQHKILRLLFPGVKPVEEAKRDEKSGMFLFPVSGAWVRLSPEYVWQPATASGTVPYIVVTCMMFHDRGKASEIATSYVVTDMSDRPYALTAGYAAYERVEKIALPVIGRSFLLVLQYTGEWGGSGQMSSFMVQVDPVRPNRTPRTVWKSPSSARKFQIGFDAVEGKSEELLMRVERGEEVEFKGYRWNGERFEEDPFTSENRLKNLPGNVWRYGSGR